MSKMLEKIQFWVSIGLFVSSLCLGILMCLWTEDVPISSIRLVGLFLILYAIETVTNLKK